MGVIVGLTTAVGVMGLGGSGVMVGGREAVTVGGCAVGVGVGSTHADNKIAMAMTKKAFFMTPPVGYCSLCLLHAIFELFAQRFFVLSGCLKWLWLNEKDVRATVL